MDCAKVYLEYLIRKKVLARWIDFGFSSLFLHLRDNLLPSITYILTLGDNLCLTNEKDCVGFMKYYDIEIFCCHFWQFLAFPLYFFWCGKFWFDVHMELQLPCLTKGSHFFAWFLSLFKLDSSTIEAFQKLRELTFVMEHIFLTRFFTDSELTHSRRFKQEQ